MPIESHRCHESRSPEGLGVSFCFSLAGCTHLVRSPNPLPPSLVQLPRSLYETEGRARVFFVSSFALPRSLGPCTKPLTGVCTAFCILCASVAAGPSNHPPMSTASAKSGANREILCSRCYKRDSCVQCCGTRFCLRVRNLKDENETSKQYALPDIVRYSLWMYGMYVFLSSAIFYFSHSCIFVAPWFCIYFSLLSRCQKNV